MSFRLAEAIRIGSKEVPQCAGFVFYDRDGKIASACALGAAAIVIGALVDYKSCESLAAYNALRDAFPELTAHRSPPPSAPFLQNWTLLNQIIWLNDCTDWTREQIADWVESL